MVFALLINEVFVMDDSNEICSKDIPVNPWTIIGIHLDNLRYLLGNDGCFECIVDELEEARYVAAKEGNLYQFPEPEASTNREIH